jgi:hypothetical protein
MPNLYDHRHFYIDDDSIGHCATGIAFQAMTSFVREHRSAMFCGGEWYEAVERFSSNPVAQGFLAEQILLTQIAQNGLTKVDKRLTTMPHAVFDAQPSWLNIISSDLTHCLYIPTAFNFPAVDGAILYLDRPNKAMHLFLIQITLSRHHKDSAETFFTQMWRSWVWDYVDADLNVESTFVWIDKNQPSSEVREGVSITSRQGTTNVHPEYKSRHIGIVDVDPRLARALKIP